MFRFRYVDTGMFFMVVLIGYRLGYCSLVWVFCRGAVLVFLLMGFSSFIELGI